MIPIVKWNELTQLICKLSNAMINYNLHFGLRQHQGLHFFIASIHRTVKKETEGQIDMFTNVLTWGNENLSTTSTRWLGFRCCTYLSLLCTCLDLRDRTLLQPQSKFVRATCLSVYPRHMQWYHSWHLKHCTISLRCSFHFSSWWKPLPNRHNSLLIQPHFHGRRGRIWLNLSSPSVAGTHRILTGWRGLSDSYIKGVTGPLYRSAPCLQQYWIISLCINCAAIETCKRPKKGLLNNKRPVNIWRRTW